MFTMETMFNFSSRQTLIIRSNNLAADALHLAINFFAIRTWCFITCIICFLTNISLQFAIIFHTFQSMWNSADFEIYADQLNNGKYFEKRKWYLWNITASEGRLT